MATNPKMMRSETRNLSSSISDISEHPMHTVLVAFPAVCFVGAFITDFVYWRSMSFVWANFSVWLAHPDGHPIFFVQYCGLDKGNFDGEQLQHVLSQGGPFRRGRTVGASPDFLPN
jgi:hypothetical protein